MDAPVYTTEARATAWVVGVVRLAATDARRLDDKGLTEIVNDAEANLLSGLAETELEVLTFCTQEELAQIVSGDAVVAKGQVLTREVAEKRTKELFAELREMGVMIVPVGPSCEDEDTPADLGLGQFIPNPRGGRG